ncbi:DUF1365 domain-containing protein [Iamia sp. SCSIO 61187]|uniref:DUF1365 domain-containing protein n=1 Tax=Iamia sp. SCSIO 61187 TaxID=2722752 RepID=UPI001C629A14|nr:DUF1365 domain-containing protein [Iamia sp. SCSIO 61187]QYG94161.1 DUF1365 domain-containing protein [Iamia sp. SCSIO 61187]
MSALAAPDAVGTTPTGLRSCLYEGTIGHRRRIDVQHGFSQPIVLAHLDLAELDEAFAAHPLWSTSRPAPVRFRRRDLHGDPSVPLDTAVRATLADRLGTAPAGPIRLLTHLRHWAWTFNPISLYFAYDAEDTRVEAVLAEVTNTPWHERTAYALAAPPPEEAEATGIRFAKAMHVSPFMDLDLDHVLRFSPPGRDRFVVEMDDRRRSHVADGVVDPTGSANRPLPAEARSARRLGLAPGPGAPGAAARPDQTGSREVGTGLDDVDAGDLVFSARMVLHRRPLDRASMTHVLLHHRLPAHRVSAGIHLNALRLWRKGAPFRRHPRHTHPAAPPGAHR